MRRMALVMCLLPVVAFGQKLEVEYKGKVEESFTQQIRVGDPVKGRFTIDPSLASPNRAGPLERERNYIWNPCPDDTVPCARVPAPSGFVTDEAPIAGESDDHVWITHAPGGDDSFGVENTERGPVDRVFHRLEVYARGFVSSLGWKQNFEVRPAESGGNAWLTVDDAVNGVNRFFTAAIDYVRVHVRAASASGSCRAP